VLFLLVIGIFLILAFLSRKEDESYLDALVREVEDALSLKKKKSSLW
jgi:hypothetical protein